MCRKISGAAFLAFIEFSNNTFEWITGTPTKYKFPDGVSLDTATGAFTIESEGDYLVVAAPQVGRLNACDTAYFRCVGR